MSESEAPNLAVDASLPIGAAADDIAALIRSHQVVIVAGETGSGKTTQLPKICLSLGRKRIGHTQPRRIAARTVAARVAQETGTRLGDLVGYQVRFTAETSTSTQLKVMTDGILLAEITTDRQLRAYDTIIIDEAHERSLNIDFLLGYLKQLLPKRKDLKVIITSATIDTARFSKHFNDAPVIEVSGRSYPVDIRYEPPAPDTDQADAITAAVAKLRAQGHTQGDILVFLSGEREIRDATDALAAAKFPGTELLPLYARLSLEEQQRVFASHPGTQRVVLATNVAETSLTVPGVRYVIDPGYARISRYSARTKVQRLPIEAISQASANQRAGRCGRVAPGICVRLYTQDDYVSRPQFTEPEMLRTNLASVILRMAQARLGDIHAFPFVEAPDERQVADGLRLLNELGALATTSRTHATLTDLGRSLARLPVDPRMGRILIEASKRNCLKEALVLVAGLSIQDVRERPVDKRAQADAMHARFASPKPAAGDPTTQTQTQSEPTAPLRHTVHTNTHIDRSDPKPDPGGDVAAMLRLWDYLRTQRKAKSSSAFRKMCRAEFINFIRVREWEDLNWQLGQVCQELGLRTNKRACDEEDLLISMVSGLLSHVGLLDTPTPSQRAADAGRGARTAAERRRGPREYIGARGARFAISPASVLAKHPPELAVAVELVETTRLWAHSTAAIKAEWVEEVGSHLLKRSYSQPHFSSDSGSVVAYEKTTLLGIPLIADRLADYAKVDPAQARSIFIQTGLVEQQWHPHSGSVAAKVMAFNERVRAQADEVVASARTQEVVLDDQSLAEWFAAHVPQEIASGPVLERWLKTNPDALLLSIDDLVKSREDDDAFPHQWSFGDAQVGIDYVFQPDSERDGATVTIPLTKLAEANPNEFTWALPGRRAELATALIRSLPKNLRVSFVPAPQWAEKALAWLEAEVNNADETAPFQDELARALVALTGVRVPPEAWHPETIPTHLRFNFAVMDGHKEVAFGKDLAALQRDLAKKVSKTLTKSVKRDLRSGTTWVFGDIPETITVARAGFEATGYPALRDEVTRVTEAVFDSAAFAAAKHRAAIIRLLLLNLPDPTRSVFARLGNEEKLALAAGPYPSLPDLLHDAHVKAVAQLVDASAQVATGKTGQHNTPNTHRADVNTTVAGLPRDEESFGALLLHVRQEQADKTQAVTATASKTLKNHGEALLALQRISAAHPAYGDMREQLENLVFNHFISFTPDPWFAQLPRFCQAVTVRAQAIVANPARDAPLAQQLDPIQDDYADLLAQVPPNDPVPPAIADIGFLIEELRVQLFAQALKTSVPVSAKRIKTAMSQAQVFVSR
ncbi:MAG: ATP-dependent RNA helicase HrpA [Propionibacteriaceae bacterium]|jgi:ATP-dependent helicase HrpA|nr:ATP-dependent RNA helicase HrpA [Propionibacteriaceae bacterium]